MGAEGRLISERSSTGKTNRGLSSEIDCTSNLPRSHARQMGAMRTLPIRRIGSFSNTRNGSGCKSSNLRISTPFHGDHETPPIRVSRPV